ncbi:hypothetical protein B7486_45675 [cyanobacterium TDX16]|nr:hypothetical protein B7486_45675 [cyanobacterium TDX16]
MTLLSTNGFGKDHDPNQLSLNYGSLMNVDFNQVPETLSTEDNSMNNAPNQDPDYILADNAPNTPHSNINTSIGGDASCVLELPVNVFEGRGVKSPYSSFTGDGWEIKETLWVKSRGIQESHWESWVKGSAIAAEMALLALESIEGSPQIANKLGWVRYRGSEGWLAEGLDIGTGKKSGVGQFRPDRELTLGGKKKPQKYLTFPKGTQSDAIFLPVTFNAWHRVSVRYGVPVVAGDINEEREDLGFWQWVARHPEIDIEVTEGIKKAACLLSHGYAGVCLMGVNNAKAKGSQEVVSGLKVLMHPRRTVRLVFDADILTKKEVQRALTVAGDAISQLAGDVRVVNWDLADGKGVDDLIVNKGLGAFDKAADRAQEFRKYKEGLVPDYKEMNEVQWADFLSDMWKESLAYDDTSKQWYCYGAVQEGVWTAVSDIAMQADVRAHLASVDFWMPNNRFPGDVLLGLRHKLLQREWSEADNTELLPFKNGVLDLETMVLLPHHPSFYFRWRLERDYVAGANDWGQVREFLMHLASGRQDVFNILLAFCNAIVKGRYNLQIFLHLQGLTGTGKGTFLKLISMLVGETNRQTSSLPEFCDDKFESANAENKRLLAFSDETAAPSSISNFLKVTGEEPIRAERKHQQAYSFMFKGMVYLASNEAIHWGKSKDAIARRQITVKLSTPVKEVRDFNPIFEAEIAAFTNAVLLLEDDWVTSILRGATRLATNRANSWADRIQTDPLAAWANDYLISQPGAMLSISGKSYEIEGYGSGTSWASITKAYPHYRRFCEHHGHKMPLSLQVFSQRVVELCSFTMSWEGVEKRKTREGAFITNVKLRSAADTTPSFDEQLDRRAVEATVTTVTTCDDLRDGWNADCVSAVTTVTTSDHINGKFEKLDPQIGSSTYEIYKNPPQVVTVVTSESQSDFQPSHEPSQAVTGRHNKPPSLTKLNDESYSVDSNTNNIGYGSRVKCIAHDPRLYCESGRVYQVRGQSRGVQFDNGIRVSLAVTDLIANAPDEIIRDSNTNKIGYESRVRCVNQDSEFYGRVGTAFREDGERCEVVFDDDSADVLAVSDLEAVAQSLTQWQ